MRTADRVWVRGRPSEASLVQCRGYLERACAVVHGEKTTEAELRGLVEWADAWISLLESQFEAIPRRRGHATEPPDVQHADAVTERERSGLRSRIDQLRMLRSWLEERADVSWRGWLAT
jgi:hypothetical protein